MPTRFLTTDEFERWAQSFDARLDRIEQVVTDVAILKDRERNRRFWTRAFVAIVGSDAFVHALSYAARFLGR